MLEGMSQEKNEETTILDTTADFTKSLTFAHKSVRIFHTCLYASKMSLAGSHCLKITQNVSEKNVILENKCQNDLCECLSFGIF